MSAVKFNRFFSLPDVLISRIFEFDNTYRIFHTKKFSMDLKKGYINMPSIRKQCIDTISGYLESSIDDGCIFNNEYGCINPENIIHEELPEYLSIDDFFIHLHPYEDIVYFKVLPVSSTKENCYYLKNPHRFDGFFCEREKSYEIIDNNYSTSKYDLLYKNPDHHPSYKYNYVTQEYILSDDKFDFWM